MKRIPCYWLVCMSVVWSAPLGAATLNPDQEAVIDGLARDARVVFVGRVVQVNASNVKTLPANRATVLVQVDELIDVPPALAGMRGQQVTVELASPDSVKAGLQAVFFATGRVYAERLALRELARLPMPIDAVAVRQRLQSAHQADADNALGDRLKLAPLVVVGKVVKLGKPPRSRLKSEHAPDLVPATIQVDLVMKGESAPKRPVTAFFSRSTDERWLRSPKLSVGQQAVFLLQREGGLGLPAGYYLLDSLDVQSPELTDKIRKLLAQTNGPKGGVR